MSLLMARDFNVAASSNGSSRSTASLRSSRAKSQIIHLLQPVPNISRLNNTEVRSMARREIDRLTKSLESWKAGIDKLRGR